MANARIGKRILAMRLRSGRTQREVADEAGIAAAYLSRLENGRVVPNVRTLGRLARVFRVPMGRFFDPADPIEPPDHCPVSRSGRCILDQLTAVPGRPRIPGQERYSRQQLEVLRRCDRLLQTEDPELIDTLSILLDSMLAWRESRRSAGQKSGRGGRRRPVR